MRHSREVLAGALLASGLTAASCQSPDQEPVELTYSSVPSQNDGYSAGDCDRGGWAKHIDSDQFDGEEDQMVLGMRDGEDNFALGAVIKALPGGRYGIGTSEHEVFLIDDIGSDRFATVIVSEDGDTVAVLSAIEDESGRAVFELRCLESKERDRPSRQSDEPLRA